MLRLDCLRAVYSELENCLVVTIMGATAAELHSLGHRPNFFHLQHAMGLASSTGLGLALSLPEQKIVVFDGDGSLLMNLGSLSTIARYRPGNLVHIVFDNESLLSVGGFATETSTGRDLDEIARASGIPKAPPCAPSRILKPPAAWDSRAVPTASLGAAAGGFGFSPLSRSPRHSCCWRARVCC